MKHSHKVKHGFELFLLFLYWVIASLVIVFFKLNYIEAMFAYLGPPNVYFALKQPQFTKKFILSSLLLGIPGSLIFDYVGHVSDAWIIYQTVFRVLDAFPVETFVWTVFYFFFIFSVYTYFFDDKADVKISKGVKSLYYMTGSLLIVFTALYYLSPSSLSVPYFYLIMVIGIFVFPIFFIARKLPHLFEKIAKTGLFFVILSLIYEIVAIHVGQWDFDNHEYIGYVTLLGKTFPMEEFLWHVLFAPAFLFVYEFFLDNKK